MALAVDTLVIDQGTTWAAAWRYLTQDTSVDPAPDPVPVDLSEGWVGRCQVRRRFDGTVLATFHSDPAVDRDGPVTLAADGTVTLSLDAGASVEWTWWKYDGADAPVFDVELERIADGYVVRLVEGTATLRAEVTEA